MDVGNVRRPDEWAFEMPCCLSEAIEVLIDGLERDDDYNLGDLFDEVDATGRYIRDIRRQYAVRGYYLRGDGIASPAIWTKEATVVGRIGNDAYDVGY